MGDILYLIIATCIAIGIYIVVRYFQKKLDETSELNKMLNVGMVKEAGEIKIQKKQFYDELTNNNETRFNDMPDTKTDTILKAKFIRKDGDADRVEITAYSYDEIEHVEYVRKLGKDGNYHTIPIKWYEYVPLEKTSPMEVIKGFNTVQDFRKKTKRDEFSQYIKNFTEDNNMIYTRGFTSFLPNRDMTCYDIEELKKLMSKED